MIVNVYYTVIATKSISFSSYSYKSQWRLDNKERGEKGLSQVAGTVWKIHLGIDQTPVGTNLETALLTISFE